MIVIRPAMCLRWDGLGVVENVGGLFSTEPDSESEHADGEHEDSDAHCGQVDGPVLSQEPTPFTVRSRKNPEGDPSGCSQETSSGKGEDTRSRGEVTTI